MLPRSGDTANGLLAAGDPPPVTTVNEGGRAPMLFVCDHASNRLPQALGRLGLDPAALNEHVAIDIGAEALTRLLAERFDAPAVLAGYSRLVIDCNRDPADITSIREISDHWIIPGNRRLSPDAVRARREAVFDPYHAVVREQLTDLQARGLTPVVVAVHTFTPQLRGVDRPWHVGILSGRDRRVADPLLAALAADESLVVGDNEPYSGLRFAGYTIEQHALRAGLPNAMIEVRQDLTASEQDVARWADLLARALAPILDDAALYTRASDGGS